MYGMIHQAARDMSLELLGEERWTAVLNRCGLGDEHFISGQHYDDDVTLRLVAAISEVSGKTPDDLLEAFGRYWITWASKSAYGSMMDMAGDTLEEFLESLDSLHASIKTTMPEASMPTFEVIAVDGARIDLIYNSERDRLHSFVAGLLGGLMEYFGESGEITHREGPDGVVFSIAREAARAA